jgi:hypothetical protein
MIQAKAAAAASAKAPSGAGSRGNKANHEQPAESQKPKSSTLPANFFENQGMKRHSDGESNKHALPSVCAKFKDRVRKQLEQPWLYFVVICLYPFICEISVNIDFSLSSQLIGSRIVLIMHLISHFGPHMVQCSYAMCLYRSSMKSIILFLK